LFGYYTFVDDGDNKSKKRSGKENEVIEQTDNRENEYENKAKEFIANMTLAEKVGQLFFARCPQQGAQSAIKDYNIGAYILFAKDFADSSKEQITTKIASYQNNAKIPLLIGVDEEGGTVTRVSRFTNLRSEKFKSPMELYNEGGLEAVSKDTADKCSFLSSFGINVNFAPVCDVATDQEAFMYTRTLGQNVNETSEYIKQTVHQMNSSNMGSVLKHFPGYGNNKDTHIGSSSDSRSMDDFREKDFLPFKAGIEAGAPCVLISHNVVKCMDPVNPASLSEKVHQVLREELGFNGVIITDDLVMDAITGVTDESKAAVKAVIVGNDMLISSSYEKQIKAVIDAVNSGEIPEDTINKSVVRILCWKMALGLIK
jgi:beta-N-acetylhexosaminidase